MTNAKNHLGDSSCIYDAKSRYLLCAVNPSGSCSECSDYVSDGQNLELLREQIDERTILSEQDLARWQRGHSQEEIFALAAYSAWLRAIALTLKD
jgi:hypothetical protein